MKHLTFLIPALLLLSAHVKAQKQDSTSHFKKNEFGINITTPVAYIVTLGNSPNPIFLMELNYKRAFKPSIYGRVNAGYRLAIDKDNRIANTENHLYTVERIRYKDSYNYYKTQNAYKEDVVFGSFGAEKRWRVKKLVSPVLALDIYASKISGQVNTYEQVVSDSSFSNPSPTKPIHNYNPNYDLGNEIYAQKINAWQFGVEISYGVIINLSKRFYVSGQLVSNCSMMSSQLTERDIVLNNETSRTLSNFDFRMRGNMNLFYRF